MERADRVRGAPTDVLRLVVAGVTLLAVVGLGLLFDGEVSDFFADLLRGLDAFPEWLVTLAVVAAQVLGIVTFGGGLLVAVLRRRWALLGSVALALVVAGLLFPVTSSLVDTSGARVVAVNDAYTPVDSGELPVGVALLAATVTTAAPWVSRRWRRAGWTVVVVVTLSWFVSAPIAFDSIVALLSGWVAGAAVVALVGAPSRRPTPASIEAGLAAVGVPLRRLERAAVDARGSSPYFGTTLDGAGVFVKALGEDERSADLMFRLYRRVVPHDLGDEKPFSTLRRAVEHEALVALAARDAGIRTPRLVAFTTAVPNGYVLAYDQIAGRSFDRLDPSEVTDDVLGAIWAQVAVMRTRRIAHRDLRLANVFLDDDRRAWIIDFGFSELAASDLLLATDVAELLASSTTAVGADRAVATATSVVGPAVVATASPRLRLAMLSGATRTALKRSPGLLDDLRSRVAALDRGREPVAS